VFHGAREASASVWHFHQVDIKQKSLAVTHDIKF